MSLVNRDAEKAIQEESIETIYEKPRMSSWAKIKIVAVLLIVLLVWWSFVAWMINSSRTLDIDNPTGSGIILQFNDMPEIKISAHTFESIDLGTGIYTVTVDGNNIGTFEKKFLDGSSFLNPTLSPYIKEEAFYGDEKYIDKLKYRTVTIGENQIEWPFEVFEDLYVKGSWNYDLDENYPSEVSVKSKKKYKIKSKIYRIWDFIDMYNREYAIQDVVENSEAAGEK